MVHFGEFLKTWNLRSNRVTRLVSFNWTKFGGKCLNWKINLRHFGWFSNTVKWLSNERSSLRSHYCCMRLHFEWFSNIVMPNVSHWRGKANQCATSFRFLCEKWVNGALMTMTKLFLNSWEKETMVSSSWRQIDEEWLKKRVLTVVVVDVSQQGS